MSGRRSFVAHTQCIRQLVKECMAGLSFSFVPDGTRFAFCPGYPVINHWAIVCRLLGRRRAMPSSRRVWQKPQSFWTISDMVYQTKFAIKSKQAFRRQTRCSSEMLACDLASLNSSDVDGNQPFGLYCDVRFVLKADGIFLEILSAMTSLGNFQSKNACCLPNHRGEVFSITYLAFLIARIILGQSEAQFLRQILNAISNPWSSASTWAELSSAKCDSFVVLRNSHLS